MTEAATRTLSRDHAFWIARSVARVLGIDLTDAMTEGRFDRSGYAELVARCEACALATGCQLWLARQAALADRPIEGCANRVAFEALRT